MRKYRLTLLFAAPAMVVIAIAAIVVNQITGNLAEDNLIRFAEENTARDGSHIQSMMRRNLSMAGATNDGAERDHTHHPVPLSLESATGPHGLPTTYPQLVEGLNIVKLNVFDLNGTTVWSTDSNTVGVTKRESTLLGKAFGGDTSSKLVKNLDVVHLDGVERNIDVVETYMPLRETRGGRIIGAMELYRDIAEDVTLQVNDAKSMVLWTTVGTMGGLFLVLFGFIVVADTFIYRSRRREVAVVEEANRTLEDRVRQRTRELVEAQDQVVRTEKLAAIGQLSASVAHDLRNPLGAINNCVYYLKRRLAGTELAQSNPRIGQFLGIVEEEVQHCNQIISDLMIFTRIQKPSLSPTNLAAAVQSSISRLDSQEKIRIVRNFDTHLPEILADREQLHRVFINLILNAQDAMPEGGDLTITVRGVDGFAEVAFTDTGTGMDEETTKRIFEPLFTTKSMGTGLGLAVCQQIVSQHGGIINVVSAPGQGANFTIKLPLSGNNGQEVKG